MLLDPWLADNPARPESMKKSPKTDLVLVSHGHADHMGDVIAVTPEIGAPVAGMFEVGSRCDPTS